MVEAAANIARALRQIDQPAALSFTMPECNTLGAALLPGKSLDAALAAVEAGEVDTLIVLENDLYRRLDATHVEHLLNGVRHLVVLDHLWHPTAARAELVLPAATFAEGHGTLVNHEGRAQRYFQVFPPSGDIRDSWQWLSELASADMRAFHLADLHVEMAGASPVFAPLAEHEPVCDSRIPRQSHRFSGRTAISAQQDVRRIDIPEDEESPLTFSMEGNPGHPSAALLPRYWSPGWNSDQALQKFQMEIGGPLRGGDPGCRLIAPAHPRQIDYCIKIPEAFAYQGLQRLVLPAHHIFGSEELSAHAPGIAACAPAPYLAIGQTDADLLGVREGESLRIVFDDWSQELPVRIATEMPAGVAALFANMPAWPLWGELAAAGEAGRMREEAP
jgi:NADH-quinone oxidoreductase subunit G